MPDPQEPQPRLPRFRANPDDEAWLRALNAAVAAADLPALAVAGPSPDRLPIVYIVGAPRSGTTLLSQVLSRFLRVGYINNLIARFWERPSVGIHLSRLLLAPEWREGLAFASEFGTTTGIAGPHEFGYFWRHWLRLDGEAMHHPGGDAIGRLDVAGLRHALEQEVLAPFGLPVVFKNLICGLHAGALAAVHPRSLFVHIVREPGATCASILASREKRYGSYQAWWSLKPSTYPELCQLSSPSEQVARQVTDIRREVDAAIGQPGMHALSLSYESLCRDPRQTLEPIVAAVEALGVPVEMLPGIPAHFALSQGTPLPAALDDELRAALAAAKG